MLADPGLLERVLVNLVANALRFAPAGHPPRLTAAGIGEHVELRVVDRGPGIAPDQRDQVFLPVPAARRHRQHHRRRASGLALSRGLTEAMGGTLEPEDTPGGGLTMVVPAEGRRRGRTRPGARAARALPQEEVS